MRSRLGERLSLLPSPPCLSSLLRLARSSHFNSANRPVSESRQTIEPSQFIKSKNPALILLSDCDGLNINCGCPQKWAIKEGYGCALLHKPELVAEMVQKGKDMSGLPVSIKIRVLDDIRCDPSFLPSISVLSISHPDDIGLILYPLASAQFSSVQLISDHLASLPLIAL